MSSSVKKHSDLETHKRRQGHFPEVVTSRINGRYADEVDKVDMERMFQVEQTADDYFPVKTSNTICCQLKVMGDES